MNVASTSASPTQSVQNVQDAIAIKLVKMANEMQKNIARLIEGVVETAAQIQEDGTGEQIDVRG